MIQYCILSESFETDVIYKQFHKLKPSQNNKGQKKFLATSFFSPSYFDPALLVNQTNKVYAIGRVSCLAMIAYFTNHDTGKRDEKQGFPQQK